VGADDYMTKPFVPEELLAKANVFLRLTLMEREVTELNQSLEIKVQERTKQLLDTEAKLITSAKMAALGEMAGGIAHEINTPLSTVRMVAEQIEELIKDTPPDQGLIAEKTQIISNTVQRISVIISGLRTFSRDGSKDRLDYMPLHRIVDDTLALCGEKIKYNSVEIKVDFPDDIKVQCRPVQVSQVLLNLIGNACDAISSQEEKWVKVSAEKKNGFVNIYVTDSGKGIPAAVREKLFQPFFTTKEIGKGTGLGLSISKGIIDAHEGSLSIDSTCANTRFVIRLPERQAEAAPVNTLRQKAA
jgi:C4-dicarboxylate-specific signal transduction histidine kinase